MMYAFTFTVNIKKVPRIVGNVPTFLQIAAIINLKTLKQTEK